MLFRLMPKSMNWISVTVSSKPLDLGSKVIISPFTNPEIADASYALRMLASCKNQS